MPHHTDRTLPPFAGRTAEGDRQIDIDLPIDALTDNWLPTALIIVILLAVVAIFQGGMLSTFSSNYATSLTFDESPQASLSDGKLVIKQPIKPTAGFGGINYDDTWKPSDRLNVKFETSTGNSLEGLNEDRCQTILDGQSTTIDGTQLCEFSYQYVVNKYTAEKAQYSFSGDSQYQLDGSGTVNVTEIAAPETNTLAYILNVPTTDLPAVGCDPDSHGYWCDVTVEIDSGYLSLVFDLDGDDDGVLDPNDDCEAEPGAASNSGCPVEASPTPQEPSSEPVQDDGSDGSGGDGADGGGSGSGGDSDEKTVREQILSALVNTLVFWN